MRSCALGVMFLTAGCSAGVEGLGDAGGAETVDASASRADAGRRDAATVPGDAGYVLSGCLSVETESGFESIYIGAELDAQGQDVLRVHNRCAAPGLITVVQLVGVAADRFAVDVTAPAPVDPFSSLEVGVTFFARDLEDAQARLFLHTNDTIARVLEVPLFGVPFGPELGLVTRDADFGAVVLGCASRAIEVAFYNIGAGAMRVDSATVSGPFELVSPATPFMLATHERAAFVARYAPPGLEEASHTGTLRFSTNGGAAEVPLSGRAIVSPLVQDVFTAPAAPVVDVLLVLDDHLTVDTIPPRNEVLARGLRDALHARGADYQIAIVSAHPDAGGALSVCPPAPAIVTTRTASAGDVLACMSRLRVRSPARGPEGFVAARAVLDDGLLFRPGSLHAVVFTSDEEEQAEAPDRFFRDLFLAEDAVAHAIAGPVLGPCESGLTHAISGVRYYWLTQNTGGAFFDVCTDWAPHVGVLAAEITVPRDTWTLSAVPERATLAVMAGGVVLAEPGYTYDEADNAIRIDPAVPAGSTVEVTYTAICAP